MIEASLFTPEQGAIIFLNEVILGEQPTIEISRALNPGFCRLTLNPEAVHPDIALTNPEKGKLALNLVNLALSLPRTNRIGEMIARVRYGISDGRLRNYRELCDEFSASRQNLRRYIWNIESSFNHRLNHGVLRPLKDLYLTGLEAGSLYSPPYVEVGYLQDSVLRDQPPHPTFTPNKLGNR
jgi:hypothetical protein